MTYHFPWTQFPMLTIVFFNLQSSPVDEAFSQLVTGFFLIFKFEQLHFVTENPLMLMETTAYWKQQFTLQKLLKT